MTGETAETPAQPGSRLRRQRERRGLTLVQASSELHIDQRLLAALEEDDYAALGAPIFVKGHLRNYARLLGLDPAELVAEYEAAQQPADPALVASRPDGPRMDEHRSRAWVGWFGWVFLLVLGVLLAGWWYYQQEGGGDFVMSNTTDVIPVPAEQPAFTPPQENATAGRTTDSAGLAGEDDQGPVERVPENEPAADDASAGAQSPAQAVVQPEPQVQESPPVISRPATTRPARGARGGLVLEFTEESWVEVYDAKGRPILYDLIGAGARREISATGQLRLFVGNTDGVEVYVGGERFNLDRYRRQDSTARFTVNVPAN